MLRFLGLGKRGGGVQEGKTNVSQSWGPADELAEGIAHAVENHMCNTLAPPNLYLATKNLVEADGSLILVYILAILGIYENKILTTDPLPSSYSINI